MKSVATLATQFEKEYAHYLEEMELLKKRVAHVRLIDVIFSKQNPFNDDELHPRFREILSGLCNTLAEVSAGADPHRASDACERVTNLLLSRKDSNNIIYWHLVACEGFVLPLIDFIEPERLLSLYADYHAANPQHQCLPNQMKIKNAIKARLKAFGLDPKKRGAK